MRSFLLVLLLLLLLFEVGLPLLIYLGRDRLIFLPSKAPPPRQGLAWVGSNADVELVEVVRPDGRRLAAYDALPAGRERGGAPVVLFLHGNAGNIALRSPLLEELVQGFGARVLMPDYSGYGGNAGTASEAEVIEDGLAAFDHLVAEGVAASRIVLYGESLGGAVALAVAERRPCAGVVVQSGFASLSSMARRIYPWLPLVAVLGTGAFPNAERATRLEAPLLVVHGAEDEIVPLAEGLALHRLAGHRAELLVIDGAGHNDLLEVAGPAYLRRLGKLFRRWIGGEP